MKRNKPLKRTQFKRWVMADRSGTIEVPDPRALSAPQPLRQLTPIAAGVRVTMGRNETFSPQPKFTYYRSTKLQLACRSIPCQCCSRTEGVHWAHSNWAVHGKGGQTKASDQFVASMCWLCHRELDQGSDLLECDRQAVWWWAHRKTVRLLVSLDRWPDDVPVPDTETYPFPAPPPAGSLEEVEPL
jgi:hypothetical protein